MTIRLDAILLVVNVTSNIIIYNFADTTLGGTVATNVLTLTYNTSSMNDTDKLLIYYDDNSGVGGLVSQLAVGLTEVQCPTTPPASDYLLIVQSVSSNTGIIYYSFATGITTTKGVSFGTLMVKLTASDKIYLISDTAAQAVQLTTKTL